MPEPRLPIAQNVPRKLPPLARRSRAAVDLSKREEVTLVVRSRGSEKEWRSLVAELTSGPPAARRYLTRAELARRWGASAEDIEAVRKFAVGQRLKVVSADAVRRCVVVSGTLEQLSRAFEVKFHAVDHPLGTFRSHRQAPRVAASIHPLLECILGLDTLPAGQPHAVPSEKGSGMDREALLKAYAIPPNLHGNGQRVAIIELGGGFYKSDLVAYFGQFGLRPPKVKIRSINGAKNMPAPRPMIQKFFESFPNVSGSRAEINWVMWTFETVTDITMAGTIAPEAEILLVQTTNNDQGQYQAFSSIITDAKNRSSVISCSWGGSESGKKPALMRALNRWFETAAVLGMTICCSSGDSGNGTLSPGAPQNTFTVQFPATSPQVLACGGTTLHPEAGTEVAWIQKRGSGSMASGGGFSTVFPLPPWQKAAGINPADWIPSGIQSGTGRAIPDVAAKANSQPGYCVVVGGQQVPCCGTSASAPLWAGVIAILNEGLGVPVGSLNVPFYDGSLKTALRDIVSGNTGAFAACTGWDACTGWGSPHGVKLLQQLGGQASSA